MPISDNAFDGARAWAGLPAHVQARIGAFALELAVGMGISEYGDEPAARAGEEASRLATALLREAVLGYDGVPESEWVRGYGGGATFLLPSCLGQACRECGCSYEDPCEEGCGWAEADLCTACAERPTVDLSPIAVAAVCRGACHAVNESPLADPATLPPPGEDLVAATAKIACKHEGEDAHV